MSHDHAIYYYYYCYYLGVGWAVKVFGMVNAAGIKWICACRNSNAYTPTANRLPPQPHTAELCRIFVTLTAVDWHGSASRPFLAHANNPLCPIRHIQTRFPLKIHRPKSCAPACVYYPQSFLIYAKLIMIFPLACILITIEQTSVYAITDDGGCHIDEWLNNIIQYIAFAWHLLCSLWLNYGNFRPTLGRGGGGIAMQRMIACVHSAINVECLAGGACGCACVWAALCGAGNWKLCLSFAAN